MAGYQGWLAGTVVVIMLALAGASAAEAACTPTKSSDAVWLWHYRAALAHPRAILRAAQKKHLRRIYLQIARPLRAYDPFLAAAHRRGIEVYALDGEPGYALNQEPLLRRIGRIRGHAFDGVQLDVEPYTLPGFRADPANYIRGYLHLLTLARREVPHALPLSAVIPAWFAQLRWRDGSVSGAVLQRADEVVVMSYQGGLRAAQRAALPVLQEAARAHKPAYIGVKPRQARIGWPAPATLSAGYVIERYRHLREWPQAALLRDPAAPRSCSSAPLG